MDEENEKETTRGQEELRKLEQQGENKTIKKRNGFFLSQVLIQLLSTYTRLAIWKI